MKNSPILKYSFYGLLAVSAAATLIVFVVMPLMGSDGRVRNNTSQNSSEHDATNSDGHHDSSSSNLGAITDLTSQSEVTIDIEDFKYSKPNIKIKKGTKVTWTNRDTMEHNVMMDHQNSDSAHDAPSNDELKSNVLAGPLLAKGESYSFTFNEASTAPYHCSPHPYMKGSVTVVE